MVEQKVSLLKNPTLKGTTKKGSRASRE